VYFPVNANESITKKTGVLGRTENSRRQIESLELTVEEQLDLGVDLGVLQGFSRLMDKLIIYLNLTDV
jgi:hypothetical protein